MYRSKYNTQLVCLITKIRFRSLVRNIRSHVLKSSFTPNPQLRSYQASGLRIMDSLSGPTPTQRMGIPKKEVVKKTSFLANTKQKVINIVGLRPYGQHFLWDMNNTKGCNGFYIEFRQNFAKETLFYDEHLKSQNIQY